MIFLQYEICIGLFNFSKRMKQKSNIAVYVLLFKCPWKNFNMKINLKA